MKSNNTIVKYNILFESYILSLKTNHSYFESNYKEKPEETINRTNLLYPFFYSFLHLVAMFENDNPFSFKTLEKMKIKLTVADFLKTDIFGNTCFDIMLLNNNKSLLSKLFECFFISMLDETTPFHDKLAFYRFDFKADRNIFSIFNSLISLYDLDLSILNKILDMSFLPLHPSLYNNDLNFEELETPIFIVTDSIYAINQEFINKELSEKVKTQRNSKNWFSSLFKKKVKNFKNSFVKCKVICLPNMIDYRENADSKIFFTNLLDYPSSHSIFSNEVLTLVTDYKWESYIKQKYLNDFYWFLCFFLIFMINFIFLLPLRQGNLTIDMNALENIDFYSFASLLADSLLILYSFKCLFNEIKQAKTLKLMRYFASYWNYVDILLIFFLLISGFFDISELLDHSTDISKVINSLSMLFFWIRLISFVRGFDGTSFMIALISEVIHEARYFLYILLLCISAFACSIHLLQTEANTDLLHSFNLFYRLTLGDFSYLDDYDVENQTMLWIYMLCSTLLLTIILLNLLIALLSDTYGKVSNVKEQSRNYELMNINFEIESFFNEVDSEGLKKKKILGRFLVYLYNESHENAMISKQIN